MFVILAVVITFAEDPTTSNDEEENDANCSGIEEEVASNLPEDFESELCVIHYRDQYRDSRWTGQSDCDLEAIIADVHSVDIPLCILSVEGDLIDLHHCHWDLGPLVPSVATIVYGWVLEDDLLTDCDEGVGFRFLLLDFLD
jgi:hypothetical protein